MAEEEQGVVEGDGETEEDEEGKEEEEGQEEERDKGDTEERDRERKAKAEEGGELKKREAPPLSRVFTIYPPPGRPRRIRSSRHSPFPGRHPPIQLLRSMRKRREGFRRKHSWAHS